MAPVIPLRRQSLARRALDLESMRLPGSVLRIIEGRELEFEFKVAPSEWGRTYDCVLRLTPDGRWPEVIVKSPCLQTLAGDRVLPHVYRHKGAGTLLCLWWPKNREWTSQMKLSDTFIPWAIDWLWYFEEWLYTGEWAGGGEHPSGTARMSDRRRRLSSP